MQNETEDLTPTKRELGEKCIKKNMLWSMGAGLIPLPLLDIAAIMGVQLKMVKELADLYEIPFSENRGKSLISALLGGMTTHSLNTGIAGSALKAIPVAGNILGFITMPVFSAATSYGLGRVFVQHFESGGTMLTLDPDKMKAYFEAQFREGQQTATHMKRRDSVVSA